MSTPGMNAGSSLIAILPFIDMITIGQWDEDTIGIGIFTIGVLPILVCRAAKQLGPFMISADWKGDKRTFSLVLAFVAVTVKSALLVRWHDKNVFDNKKEIGWQSNLHEFISLLYVCFFSINNTRGCLSVFHLSSSLRRIR